MASPFPPKYSPFLLPALPKPRRIVCCFDGTGNKFGANSNVVRFFQALDKENPDKQIVYYQPGIGTYTKRRFMTTIGSQIMSVVDEVLALQLNDHVIDGYQFLMQNYRKGDKICLFGFSRGAYTARVIMGMLYKVGILPPDNIQQIDFALSVYLTKGMEGNTLSREFKAIFSLPVTVEFVGVWDTVASVGAIPQSYPYTAVNYAVKTFRHALALDERRSRFRPKTWYQPTLERELELDIEEPDFAQSGSTQRDDWEYEPLNRNFADVKEVWFSGCHADIGGGSHHNRKQNSLSLIPLRWMIKETVVTGTEILFRAADLKSIGFDLVELGHEHRLGLDVRHPRPYLSPLQSQDGLHVESTPSTAVSLSPPPRNRTSIPLTSSRFSFSATSLDHLQHFTVVVRHAINVQDTLAKICDQLVDSRFWWLLEFYPSMTTYQEYNGDWTVKQIFNFGLGRNVPYNPDSRMVMVHNSVKQRIEDTQKPYKPHARNWDALMEFEMIDWVD